MILLAVEGGEIVVQRERGAQEIQIRKSISLLKKQLNVFK